MTRHHWRVWFPAWILAGATQFFVASADPTLHWSASAATALFAAGVPFALGFWAIKALTTEPNPWGKAAGGLVFALAIAGYTAFRH